MLPSHAGQPYGARTHTYAHASMPTRSLPPPAPLLQSTVASDASGSSYHPMRRAIIVAYTILTSIWMVVSVVGYWAWGNGVSGFLLSQLTHPKWLVTLANAVCLPQLMVSEQVRGQRTG